MRTLFRHGSFLILGMRMERIRPAWTDERLDDLSRRMDQGFDRVDADLRGMRGEIAERFDSLHRLVIQVGGGICASLLITLVGILATRG